MAKRISRRGFLRASVGTLLCGGAAAVGYACRIEPHWLEIVRRDLPIEGLPPALHDRTLVQISDLHIGRVVDDDYIRGAIVQAAALKPDVLAITGDFMTCRGAEEIDHVCQILRVLRPARLATLAIMGNHDYAHSWSHSEVADELTDRLKKLGVDVLRNQARSVEGLQVIGLDDFCGPRFQPNQILARATAPALVLCHNPDACDAPVWSGYRGWILAGHTHGGQCKPPFLPPPLLPVKNRRYTSGEFDLYDGRRLYVNRGLGYLLRARFNARPEITLFTLKAT